MELQSQVIVLISYDIDVADAGYCCDLKSDDWDCDLMLKACSFTKGVGVRGCDQVHSSCATHVLRLGVSKRS